MEDKENEMNINVSGQEQEQIDDFTLLKRGRRNSTTITIRISTDLLRLVDERLAELRQLGVNISRNELINRLLLAFIKSPIKLNEYNIININIDKIDLKKRDYIMEESGVVHHTTRVVHHTYDKKEMPPELKELIRKVIRTLKTVKYMSKEEKIRTLEELLDNLLKYKDWPLAQHYISVIEFELGR